METYSNFEKIKTNNNDNIFNNDIKSSTSKNKLQSIVSEVENKQFIEPQTQNPETNNENKNTVLDNIGKFFLTIFISIFTGLFNFIKSNWIILLIIGIIGFIIYYIINNAMNFVNEFTKIGDIIDPEKLKPLLDSSIDIFNSTISNIDPSINNINMKSTSSTNSSSSDNSDNLINSLTKPTTLDNNQLYKNTLETTLKSKTSTKNLDEINDQDSDQDSDEDNYEDNYQYNYEDRDQDQDIDSDKKNDIKANNKTFNINNLTTTNNNNIKKGVSGYCFIGIDNGIRSCAEVGKNNKCMSGEIFPTLDICIDPSLRE